MDITPELSEQELRGMLASIDREIADHEETHDQVVKANALYDMKFLPTQQKYLDAINSGEYHVVLLTAGNKLGKTWVQVYDLISESLGYQPHDGTQRPRSGYDIALIVRDYDTCAMKIYREGFLQMLPKDCVRVVSRTQNGVPRIIQPVDPITGVEGKNIHLFSHDQDATRAESGSWQRVGVDEPCPERHFQGLTRGLVTTGGMCTMTMTLLEGSAWVWEKIHMGSSANGGENSRYLSLVAHPDENRESKGGFIPDQGVDDYRKSIPRELWDARVLGKALHLTGRVYKEWNRDIHVLNTPLYTKEEIDTFPKVLCIDPHDRLPFMMTWAFITPGNDLIVYDEWPDVPFDQLSHNSFTLEDYATIINSHDLPTWGLVDPNYGRRKSLTTGLTIAEELTVRTGIGFITDIDDTVAAGHLAVSERLYYDTEKPMTALNQPKLFVMRSCRNHIQSFENYIWQEWRGKTAEGKSPNPKPQEKYKHAMDNVRYICVYPAVKYAAQKRKVLHSFGKQRRPEHRSLRSRLAM